MKTPEEIAQEIVGRYIKLRDKQPQAVVVMWDKDSPDGHLKKLVEQAIEAERDRAKALLEACENAYHSTQQWAQDLTDGKFRYEETHVSLALKEAIAKYKGEK